MEYKFVPDVCFGENENDDSPDTIVFGSASVDKYLVIQKKSAAPVKLAIQCIQESESISSIEDKLEKAGYHLDLDEFLSLLLNSRLLSKESDGKVVVADNEAEKANSAWGKPKELFKILVKDDFYFPFKHKYTFLFIIFPALISLLIVVFIMGFGDSSLVPFPRVTGERLAFRETGFKVSGFNIGFGIIISFCVIFMSTIFHELGHLAVGLSSGLKLKYIGIRNYFIFFFSFFIITPGFHLLGKKKKIQILLAGPIMNLTLANIAFSISAFVDRDGFLFYFLYAACCYNYMNFIFNLLPFLPTDGYKVISMVVFKNIDIKLSLNNLIKNKKPFASYDIYHKLYTLILVLFGLSSFVFLNTYLHRVLELLSEKFPSIIQQIVKITAYPLCNFYLLVQMKYLIFGQKRRHD